MIDLMYKSAKFGLVLTVTYLQIYTLLKVQMKCFFLFPNLKEELKSGRLPFTVS